MQPGLYSLTQNEGALDLAIAGAGEYVCDVLADMDGITAMAIDAKFAYGAGGTSVSAVVQTSLNDGASWIPIARFDFTTASAEKVTNHSALTPKTPYAVAALNSEGAVDGILGPRFRAVVTVVGTYTGPTSLSIRGHAR